MIVVEGIEETVKRGYAFEHEGQLEGGSPVGGSVTGPDGRVIGAFSVASPTNRLQGSRFGVKSSGPLLETATEVDLPRRNR